MGACLMPKGMYEGVTWIPASRQQLLFDQQTIVLESIGDVGGAPIQVQEQRAPFQDGSTWLSSTLEPREMVLEVTLLDQSRTILDELRRRLIEAFHPSIGPGV